MGVTAVVILAVSYLANRPAEGGSSLTSVVLAGSSAGPAPEVGETAPDFSATTIDGKKVTLSKLRGKPLWLTFGASWCQPCRAENPDIETTYEKYRKKGLQVLAVFIQDDKSTIADYARRAGLTYPKVDDSSDEIASGYRIAGIPSHFFIDGEGVLRAITIGTLDPSNLDSVLNEIGVDIDGSAH